MRKFDIDEQIIYEQLSKITVDSSELIDNVKNRLYDKVSDEKATHGIRWRRSVVIAVVISIMLIATVTAASLGGFEWFMQKFNPPYSVVVQPIELYSEDQGIRMEVIGAQKYDNMAVVYLSLQDISGHNRLTEQAGFLDGFNVEMHPKVLEELEDEGIIHGSFSMGQELIYFDRDSNTLYYELNIITDPDTPLADPLKLSTFIILFDEEKYIDEPISIPFEEVRLGITNHINEEQVWGGRDIPDELSLHTDVLIPGHHSDIPYGNGEQWISNIGIVNEKLHVQIGRKFGDEFGSSDATLKLKDSDGNFISSEYELYFYTDEENQILDNVNYDYSHAKYKYKEIVFNVEIEKLSEYTFQYTSSYSSGIEGNWEVTTNLSKNLDSILTLKKDIRVEDYHVERITLNPIGLQIMGTYSGKEPMPNGIHVEVESTNGIISLEGGGGSSYPINKSFNSSWQMESPIDVNKVTAIIINDTRIPVE